MLSIRKHSEIWNEKKHYFSSFSVFCKSLSKLLVKMEKVDFCGEIVAWDLLIWVFRRSYMQQLIWNRSKTFHFREHKRCSLLYQLISYKLLWNRNVLESLGKIFWHYMYQKFPCLGTMRQSMKKTKRSTSCANCLNVKMTLSVAYQQFQEGEGASAFEDKRCLWILPNKWIPIEGTGIEESRIPVLAAWSYSIRNKKVLQ